MVFLCPTFRISGEHQIQTDAILLKTKKNIIELCILNNIGINIGISEMKTLNIEISKSENQLVIECPNIKLEEPGKTH
jgi:hypothetical protein